jgi:K+-transporting ATPase ATPase C chain
LLIDRVTQSAASLQAENPGRAVPADLVTTSASGLDPDITPAAALYQVPRVARERGASENDLRQVITKHTARRQLQFLGESRVNVVELNLDLDATYPVQKRASK